MPPDVRAARSRATVGDGGGRASERSGAYAWAVTVAPVAWARGASVVAKGAVAAALVALALGVLGERRWGRQARFASLWGFLLASALAWSGAPQALGPLRIDAPRGLAGMLGWALFALASAAPPLGGRREEARVLDELPLAPRKGLARGDAAYLAAGALVAVALQAIGWRVASVERALLVRFVAIAVGLAVVGASTDVALARHLAREPRPARRRLRRAMASLVALGLLVFTGVLFAARG